MGVQTSRFLTWTNLLCHRQHTRAAISSSAWLHRPTSARPHSAFVDFCQSAGLMMLLSSPPGSSYPSIQFFWFELLITDDNVFSHLLSACISLVKLSVPLSYPSGLSLESFSYWFVCRILYNYEYYPFGCYFSFSNMF